MAEDTSVSSNLIVLGAVAAAGAFVYFMLPSSASAAPAPTPVTPKGGETPPTKKVVLKEPPSRFSYPGDVVQWSAKVGPGNTFPLVVGYFRGSADFDARAQEVLDANPTLTPALIQGGASFLIPASWNRFIDQHGKSGGDDTFNNPLRDDAGEHLIGNGQTFPMCGVDFDCDAVKGTSKTSVPGTFKAPPVGGGGGGGTPGPTTSGGPYRINPTAGDGKLRYQLHNPVQTGDRAHDPFDLTFKITGNQTLYAQLVEANPELLTAQPSAPININLIIPQEWWQFIPESGTFSKGQVFPPRP